jgi:hypothetical protein
MAIPQHEVSLSLCCFQNGSVVLQEKEQQNLEDGCVVLRLKKQSHSVE